MASPLQTAVTYIRLRDYLSLVAITAVGYDYTLTLTTEIEYIWGKPWTMASTLFVLARYFGLGSAVIVAIWGSSFFPGTANICGISLLFAEWSFWTFLCAADLGMILRVRALYNRSGLIVGIVLVLYAMQAISFLVYFVIFSARLGTSSAMHIAQLLQFLFCVSTDFFVGSFWLQALPAAVQITLGGLMCLLVAARIVKELVQMYEITKCCQLNHYMKHILREGMIYFIVILIFAVLYMLVSSRMNTVNGQVFLLITVVQLIPPVTLIPRFIFGLRQLYARDLQGRRGSDTDTAFGPLSKLTHGAAPSAMIFAHPELDAGEEQGDAEAWTEREILEIRRTSSV